MKHSPRPQRTTTFQIAPRKSLGQHFLVDAGVIGAIADAAHERAGEEESLLEIGPGEGALTQQLLARGRRVIAVEKDSRSVEGLRSALEPKHPGQLEVVAADVLEWRPEDAPTRFCVGNLPYYITSDILIWLCRHQQAFSGSLFMIQKEVAERLVSPPGEKDYGRLTVRMQSFFHMDILFTVPASAFAPPPKVESAVVALSPKGFGFANEQEERFFEAFTTTLFSARRKMLRRSLASTLDSYGRDNPHAADFFWQEAARIGVTPDLRPDVISPADILALMHILLQMHK